MKQFLFFSYSFLILATAVFLIAFAMYAWRNRERMVVLGFIIWMLSITGWLITHFSMLVTDPPGFLLWALKIEFFFQVFIPPAFLLFSIQFSGHNRWYYSWRPLFLFVAPVTLFLLSMVEKSNTWLWSNLQIDISGSFLPLSFQPGWLYSVYWAFAYICFFIAAYILLFDLRIRGKIYRQQVFTILVAALIPQVSNLFFLFYPQNPVAVNLAPLGFAISAVVIGFALFRYRLFDLSPITYHALIEKMPEAILILDNQYRILHINLQGSTLFGIDQRDSIGEPIYSLLPDSSPWRNALLVNKQNNQQITISDDNQTRYFEMETTCLPDQADWHEKLVVIKDITKEQVSRLLEKSTRRLAEVRAMELSVLRKNAERLNQMVELDEILDVGLQEIVSSIGARFAYVSLTDEYGNPYMAGSFQLPPLLKSAFDRFAKCPPCDTFQQFMTAEYQEPVSFLPCPVLEQASISYPGLISVPLHLGERYFGVLYLIMAPNTVFSGDEIRLLQTIGDQYSAAIDRARLFANIEKMAILDSLTGLFSRRHFFQLSQIEFDRACRHHHPVSIIMLDIDHFKRVNDVHGHLVGDQMLQKISAICRSVLRSSDLMGRYGGDEFVILLPETDMEGAMAFADRLHDLIMEAQIVMDQLKISLTVSMGIASLDEDYEYSLEEVLEQADQALLKAKAMGRNQVARLPN